MLETLKKTLSDELATLRKTRSRDHAKLRKLERQLQFGQRRGWWGAVTLSDEVWEEVDLEDEVLLIEVVDG